MTTNTMVSANTENRSIYYSLLDILRFLAAVFVMLFHYYSASLEHNKDILSIIIVHGYLGVELFFIISGFVIYNSLKDKSVANITGSYFDWRGYAWSRLIRLYPQFWILCTITYIMTIYMASSHLPFTTYIMNLLIINNGKTANMIDGSYWTLTIEILFYLYIAIYTFILGRKNIIYFFTLWLMYSFISYAFGFSEIFMNKLLLVRYAPYFVYGGAMAMLMQYILSYNKISNNVIRVKSIAMPLILMISSVYMSKYISNSLIEINSISELSNKFGIFNGVNQILVYCIFIIATVFTLLSPLVKDRKTIKVLQIIGLATYPLYLIHQRIGSMIIELYTDFGAINIYSILIAVILILVSIYIGIVDRDIRKYITNTVLPNSKLNNN